MTAFVWFVLMHPHDVRVACQTGFVLTPAFRKQFKSAMGDDAGVIDRYSSYTAAGAVPSGLPAPCSWHVVTTHQPAILFVNLTLCHRMWHRAIA